MSKASEAARARRAYLRENEPEKYEEYLQRQRDIAKARRDKLTPEEKRNEWRIGRTKTSQSGDYQRYERKAWRAIIGGMKARAEKKGMPFDDTIDIDFMISICPTHCPVLGIELKRQGRDDSNRHASPSVDRLDPRAGYTRGNIIVVSYLANTIRNAATADQILAVGAFYKKLLDGLGIIE